MYYFSNWFPAISSYLDFFLEVIHSNRGVSGWQSHCINDFKFKSLYHSYNTKPPSDCIVESHRFTIDLQYCYSGGELISYGSAISSHIKYLQEKDKDIWSCDLSSLTQLHLSESSFVLFRPNQLHCPQQFDGKNKSIEKVVLKLPSVMLNNISV